MKSMIQDLASVAVCTVFLAATGCAEASADELEPDADDVSDQDGHDALAGCPVFEASYSTCEKVDGLLPPFFESVSIAADGQRFAFTTTQLDGESLETLYIPDRVLRLGSDYHTIPDGEVLPDLPSMETSYCEEDRLVRREFTVLPDRQLAEEQIDMWIDEDGELNFVLVVNGDLLMEARCRA